VHFWFSVMNYLSIMHGLNNINYIRDIFEAVLATNLFCSTGNILFLREDSTNFI